MLYVWVFWGNVQSDSSLRYLRNIDSMSKKFNQIWYTSDGSYYIRSYNNGIFCHTVEQEYLTMLIPVSSPNKFSGCLWRL